MKTKRILATLLLSTVALTACGTQVSQETPRKSQVTTSSPTASPTEEAPRNERAFLIVANSQDALANASDTNLVALGDAVCAALARGASDIEIMASLMDTYDYSTASQLYAAAITFLCPPPEGDT